MLGLIVIALILAVLLAPTAVCVALCFRTVTRGDVV